MNVVIGKSSAVFQLFPSEDKPLLVWGDALLVLDFGFDVVYCVGRLHLKSDGYTADTLVGLNRNLMLHTQAYVLLPVRVLTNICILGASES